MDYKATLMVLVLVSSALAGCTGDPDGGGNDEIDSDALQDLFDEHFEDFINNTTITVNNHYHNNTTVVNNDYNTNHDYNNTTNVDGGEINNYNQYNGSGAGSGSIMQMFTVNWNHADDIQIIDYGSKIVTLNDTLQQTSGEPNLLYALVYNGNLIEFRDVNCEQFYSFANPDDNRWRDYLEDNYGYESGSHSAAQQLENFWRNNAYYSSSNNPVDANGENVQQQCLFGNAQTSHFSTVFEIQLSVGQALDFMSLPNLHDITLECDDGYSGSSRNGSVGNYLGGQANCTVSGIAEVESYHDYSWGSAGANSGGNNNSSSAGSDLSNIPDWWFYDYWYFFENSNENYANGAETYSYTPLEFAVYFTTYFVEVYDLDSE